MGIRETISRKSAVFGAGAFLIVAAAIAYSVHSMMPSNPFNNAYFTTDDGQSMFSGSIEQIPPFDRHGEPAVRAWAFTCDGGKTKFVGYLERYTPVAKTRLETEAAGYKTGKLHTPPSPGPADSEVKKPGAGNPWISRSDSQKAYQVMHIQCPDGGNLDMALP